MRRDLGFISQTPKGNFTYKLYPDLFWPTAMGVPPKDHLGACPKSNILKSSGAEVTAFYQEVIALYRGNGLTEKERKRWVCLGL